MKEGGTEEEAYKTVFGNVEVLHRDAQIKNDEQLAKTMSNPPTGPVAVNEHDLNY
jgi:hypothetical protein